MKPLIFLTVLLLSIPGVSFSQNADITLLSISSPEELADWLSSDFLYRWKLPDEAQTPQETLQSKAGDCEDFAILASAVLTRLGIPNEILIIKFRDLKIKHAVCIWKNKDGQFSFISNKELFHTRKDTIERAIKKFYPDCEKIQRAYFRANSSL